MQSHIIIICMQQARIIMHVHACASEVYGSVLVCVAVCLCRLLYIQLFKEQFLYIVMFSWMLFVDLHNNASFSNYG